MDNGLFEDYGIVFIINPDGVDSVYRGNMTEQHADPLIELQRACNRATDGAVLNVVTDKSVWKPVTDKEYLPLIDAIEDKSLRINFFVIEKDSSSLRHKRASGGMDLYNTIAVASGGTVFQTSKDQIAAVVDIIKDSVSALPPITINKLTVAPNMSTVNIPVDETVKNLTIKIQGGTTMPSFILAEPSGSSYTAKTPLGTQLTVIKVPGPTPGMWKLTRSDSQKWDVDITGNSTLDFTHKLTQPGPGGIGQYPLVGRPIAGSNTTVAISVPHFDLVQSVDSLILLDANGALLDNVTLHNVGGRRGQPLFSGTIIIPSKEFKIAIEGYDKHNHRFQRMNPILMSTLAIKLEVLQISGTLYKNEKVEIPYRITNVGSSTSLTVSITDDQSFAQSPTSYNYMLATNANQTGKFVLLARGTKGVTTTVTISVKPDGVSDNKIQFSVRRITVEERLVTKAPDKTPPSCNILRVTGKCDVGTDVCRCSSLTWSMTVVGQDTEGMLSAFVSGESPKATFSKDTFSAGYTGNISASISDDCCHQNAIVTFVDLSGNVGRCHSNFTPGFIQPDPKLCEKPGKLTVPSNGTHISCTILDMSECNLSDGNNTGAISCDAANWTMKARLGTEGFGRYQIVAVDAGSTHTLKHNNYSVEFSTDCCHTDVFINIIDIGGNMGQCEAKPKVTKQDSEPSKSSSNSKTPIGLIAGAAVGGVAVPAGLITIPDIPDNSVFTCCYYV
ncbi:hypothetical protein ACJMK2_021326 [Sinanodonta woodiana]|uniref:Uncharacterized protein n=1 Tax=Sinanodonta woodiana TaxID=1069815 RepID=A0ABD3TFS3_SINWO